MEPQQVHLLHPDDLDLALAPSLQPCPSHVASTLGHP